MAPASRRPNAAVIEQLFHEPGRFEFMQAVRLLEQAARMRARAGTGASEAQPVGHDGNPASEAVRFRVFQSLTFPPAEIARMQESGETGEPPEMEVSFLGLTGPSAALPQPYTELLIRNLREKNRAMRDFFDIFNHRVIAFFYRAWAKYRLPVAYESGEGRGDDPISSILFSLIGFGTPHLRRRLSVDDQSLVYYAGLFGRAPKSATALEAILSDYFERPIRIEQFRGHWLYLAKDETTLMPSPGHPDGRYCRLGVDAVVGERVWDVQSRFRIRIGPLSYAAFRKFVPDGDDLRRLSDLTRSFVGPAFTFDVELTLAKEEVPQLRLGAEGAQAPRLGWTTWLKDREFFHDPSDAVFVLKQ